MKQKSRSLKNKEIVIFQVHFNKKALVFFCYILYNSERK